MRNFALGLSVAVFLGAGTAHAQQGPFNLTLAGASPGGMWSLVGTGVNAAVAAAYPNSVITYQTTGGGLPNIQLVTRKSVPMGLATDSELMLAKQGKEPFKTPVDDLRVLFRVYANDFQVNYMLLTKAFAERHGIASFADLVAKKAPVRVAVNRRGNLAADLALRIMGEMGASEEDITKWGGQVVYAASSEQGSLIADRRIDMIHNQLPVPHSSILEANNAVPLMLLQTPGATAEKVARETAGRVCTIRKGAYDFVDQDVTTICHGAVVFAHKDMDDNTAYALVKAMAEQFPKYSAVHRQLSTLQKSVLAEEGPYPFHPGSIKYLKEAAMLK